MTTFFFEHTLYDLIACICMSLSFTIACLRSVIELDVILRDAYDLF